MDLSAYINSGVLELYVLDRLAPDERRRVEAYAGEYPEVRTEINQIEEALEEYSLLRGQATPPSPQVLTNVLSRIQPSTGGGGATNAPPQAAPSAATVPPASGTGDNRALWILGGLFAVALAGLLFLLGQNHAKDAELGELQSEFNSLETNYNDLQSSCNQIAENYQADQQQLQILTSIDTRGIVLSGSDNAPDSRALVFYNEADGEVLFTASNLPPPPAGRQYQLWAINGDGPQDLGVLDLNLSNEALLSVPFVPNAAAFAITLEEAGGRPTPDLTQLQVIGQVSS